jgi:excisionase family DNA binding protein
MIIKPSETKLLSFKAAAARLGASWSSIERLAKSGELVLVRLGRRSVRIDSHSIDDLIQRRAGGRQPHA